MGAQDTKRTEQKHISLFGSMRLLIISLLLAFSSAFIPSPSFVGQNSVTAPTELQACRVNAKKEKRQRNRENMRKFRKRGGSKRKQMRKIQGNNLRQMENEFVAKCFIALPAVEE